MENSSLNKAKIISIVATKSNTGKTTLIEALIPIFKKMKYKVGVLKHDAHKFEIDKEGKDSYRFAQAGADKMVISSKEKIAMVEKIQEEKDIEEILKLFVGVDLIIIEGYKNNNYPKIEVHRKEVDSKLLIEDEKYDRSKFLAIATDEILNVDIQQLHINDVNGIAEFIERKIIKEEQIMNKTLDCTVSKIEDDIFNEEVAELLVREYPLTIFLNGKKLATLLCSPENLKALTIGFLRTEGLITTNEDIESFNLNEEKGITEVITKNKDSVREGFFSKKIDLDSIKDQSDDGINSFLEALNCKPVLSDAKININKIFEFMRKNLDYSDVFKNTGGVHCVALCDNREMLVVYEDVARHNALDKVIGESLMRGIFFKDKVVILSGRVSLEMILKAAKLEIPIIISKSAPTSLSVALAKKLNITLVGFVRGNKMNIYANGYRVNH
ncbi:formate dehydrogenase accessory sulfurtransferase FdhD [Clostridium sp. SHJSY1]|uniref:formate dehydrogenase accessory sulfurtransferase FdhD n=1 Tax=Clostridium sp. SHJSY1 TaxID=2942483 RepID=UPI00287B936C|nr:formate dehydrogenase accessory sulfurtransferase FdhD [Clostridium sp. SHJSY1]